MRYRLTLAIFAAAFALTACASSRDMFGHNDGISQHDGEAMAGIIGGMR